MKVFSVSLKNLPQFVGETICFSLTANILSDSDVANYKQEIKRRTPYSRGMQSFSPGVEGPRPFPPFCSPDSTQMPPTDSRLQAGN